MTTSPEADKTKRIYILTAWSKHRFTLKSRSWFWASSREQCLEILARSTDSWLEEGSYTHAIIEAFDEGNFLAQSEEWFEVSFDPESQKYGVPKMCESQDRGVCNWGLG